MNSLSEEVFFSYKSITVGYKYNFDCYSILLYFSISSSWKVPYIIQFPWNHLDPTLVGHLSPNSSTCPIRHPLCLSVSCGSQGNTVQGSSPYKCSQEVWWDTLNVMVATIPSVMSGLTRSPKLFLYSMTYKLELFLVLQRKMLINIKSFKIYVLYGLLILDSSFFTLN